jgi:CRISPR/Cas system CMR subunit Cmr6 (Cas7 group RAMP superfamily)
MALTLYAEVLTPLHIGGASEKHAQKGLDYIQQGNQVFMIDEKKLLMALLEKNKLDDYSYEIAENATDVQSLLAKYKINPATIAVGGKSIQADRVTDDLLRTFVKNGLGQEYVPGSSIKGAVRSVLFHHFSKEPTFWVSGNIRQMEEVLFGKIDHNLMRFIQMTDANIDRKAIQILNTKVMSRDKNEQVTWKHQRSGSQAQFDTTSFTTNYECVVPKTIFNFRYTVNQALVEFITKQKKELPPHSNILLGKDPDIRLLEWIDSYTKSHIQKEIAFLEHNKTPETTRMMQFLQTFLIDAPNTYLMRMAHGSGFHGITGDWQYDDHTVSLKNLDGDRDNKRYKTRRIAIYNGDLMPMGFLRLYKSPVTKDNLVINRLPKVTVAVVRPPYFKGTLKNRIEISAELIEIAGKIKKFKLLVGEVGQEPIVELSYAGDLEMGTFHKVSISDINGKTKKITIQYKSELK